MLDPRPITLIRTIPDLEDDDIDYPDRVIRLFTQFGTDRVVMDYPSGPGFGQWHTLTEGARQTIAWAIRHWKGTKPNRRVGLTLGPFLADPFCKRPHPEDTKRPTPLDEGWDWRWVCQEILPWVMVGLDEVWVHLRSPTVSNGYRLMASHICASYGLRMGLKNMPLSDDLMPKWQGLKWPVILTWPWLQTHMSRRHGEAWREGWRVPVGVEVHVLDGPPEIAELGYILSRQDKAPGLAGRPMEDCDEIPSLAPGD